MLRAISDAGKAADDAVLILWLIIINAVSECHDRLCKPCIQCQCCWQISASMCFSPAIPCHAIPYPSSPNRIRWEEACLQRRGSLWIGARPDIFDWRTPWNFEATGVRCHPDAKKCRLHRQIFMMWHAGLRGGASIWSWVLWILWHDQLMNVGMMAWRYCFGPDTWIGTMGRSRTTWHQKQTAKCHCAGDRWQLSFPSTFLQHGEDMKS